MKITTTMPSKGQFIVVWKHAGVLWSSTIMHQDHVLYIFLPFPGSFAVLDPDHPALTGAAHFIVMEETDEEYVEDLVTIH